MSGHEDKIYKLTKRDFKTFAKACLTWQKALGLLDWEITLTFDLYPQKSRDESVEAWCDFKEYSRVVTIALKKEQFYPFTSYMLKKAAFHEMAHLLLADLDMMATEGGAVPTREVDKEVHKIIVRLTNVFFPDP